MAVLGQILLLLWKNFLIQRRSPIWTFFELFVPSAVTGLLLLPAYITYIPPRINTTTEERFTRTATYLPLEVRGDVWDFEPNKFLLEMLGRGYPADGIECGRLCFQQIYFSPETPETMALMEKVTDRLSFVANVSQQEDELPPDFNFGGFFSRRRKRQSGFMGTKKEKIVIPDWEPNITITAKGFGSKAEMEAALLTEYGKCHWREIRDCIWLWGGVAFELDSESKVLRYEIRMPNANRKYDIGSVWNLAWNTRLQYHDRKQTVRYWERTQHKSIYWENGFLTLQRAIDLSWIDGFSSSEQAEGLGKVNFRAQRLAESEYRPPSSSGQGLVSIILYYAFLVVLIFTIRTVVHEKEQGLKEYMKVMGLRNWVQWFSHFLASFIKLSIFCVIVTVILTIEFYGQRVFTFTDPSFIFAFLLVLSAGLICYAFAISVFFQSATPAMACGGILYFLLSIAAGLIVDRVFESRVEYIPWGTQKHMLHMLLNNVAMSQGIQLIIKFERKGAGMQWKYLFDTINADEHLSMALIIGMLFVDMLICILVTWYVDAVAPGAEGVPQKPWFPLQGSYWFGGAQSSNEAKDAELGAVDLNDIKAATVEPVPPSLSPTIDISGLVKVYKQGKVLAVNGLSVQMYPNQITALLGHNGAGKTTTMKILTGTIPSSKGKITINGFKLEQSLSTIRQQLGMCPQHNILFNMLTVHEHLKLFCKLKGRQFDPEEENKMLQYLNLAEKKNVKVKTLSGGMKRKVLVAVALIGGSEVVFLDEPTSGMDPAARHSMWEFLKKEKHGRTIILSTHYMEEADVLGDRIAIIAKGQLQCCGSSLFLKKHYGTGYNMTVVFEKDQKDGTKAKELISLVKNFCPDAKLESALGLEATVSLPQQSSGMFGEMFADLEGSKTALGISSFGISITTMEDVFLRVGEIADQAENNEKADAAKDVQKLTETTESAGRSEGPSLWIQQFRGLIIKKMHLCRRYWVLAIPQLIVPIFFACLVILLYRIDEVLNNSEDAKPTEMPPLSLNLEPFGQSNIVFLNNDSTTTSLIEAYKNLVSGNSLWNLQDTSPDSVDKYLLDEFQRTNLFDIERRFITGAEFMTNSTVTAYFQGQTQHTDAIATNMFDTAMLHSVTGGQGRIETTNYPLSWDIWGNTDTRPTGETRLKPEIPFFASFLLGFMITLLVFGQAFLVSSFVVLLVKERTTGAKHLQLLSGTHQVVFWLSHWLWDAVTFLIPCVIMILLFVIFKVGIFVYYGSWFPLLIGFLMYGLASVTRAYVISFIFESGPKAFMFSCVICLVIGLPLAQILPDIVDRDPEKYGKYEPPAAILFPNYCLKRVLSFIGVFAASVARDRMREACPDIQCTNGTFDNVPSTPLNMTIFAWEDPGMGKFLGYFAGQAAFYWCMVILCEFGFFKAAKSQISVAMCAGKRHTMVGFVQQNAIKGDEDTEAEATLVSSLSPTDHPLLVRYLRKIFGAFTAVDGISFHVEKGQCFGLLGVNGAGKTTTFEMLVGNHTVTAGEAKIDGKDVASNWRSAGSNLGYCPQFDALIENMTGEEMLALFARLRGIPEARVNDVIQAVIAAVNIGKYAPKMTKTYSGGNKRRLSLGLALVGLPKVLLLDEPTTGVDPAARRAIWEILSQLRKHGVGIVLSSHSMEECDALCTRIAIMVRGRFVCIGSAQHLKSKYGTGYSLQLKVEGTEHVNAAKLAVEEKFPGSVLKEVHEQVLIYELPQNQDVKWSAMFSTLEGMVDPLKIVDYSLSQTTLEQVFLRFSREGTFVIVGAQPVAAPLKVESVA